MRFSVDAGSGSLRVVLLAAVVGVVAYGALQVSSVVDRRQRVRAKEAELGTAQLMASVVTPLGDARRLLAQESGCSGDPLPDGVVAALEEKYTLTGEEGKPLLRRATATQLATDLGVDRDVAVFILGCTTAPTIEALAQRKRNVFEQNAGGIAPLIVRRVSEIAAQSHIEKLDQFKVGPRRQTRRSASKATPSGQRAQPDVQNSAAIRQGLAEAEAAIASGDGEELRVALSEVARIASGDPTVQGLARKELDGLLGDGDLSGVAQAQVRLAALSSEPELMRIGESLLRAHIEAVLASAHEPEKPSAEAGDDTAPPDDDENAPPTDDGAAEAVEVAEETGTPDAPVEGGPASGDADASDAVATPPPAPADEAPPIVYVSPPFPALAQLEQPVQRRLLAALSENGGRWLSTEEIARIIEGEPDTAPADEKAGDEETVGTDEDGDASAPSGEPGADIWSAARTGDLDALRTMLAGGANADELDSEFGITPLGWAALLGQSEAGDLLLESGADVNARFRDGGTALHAAAFLGRSEVVELLVRRGADADAKNDRGDAPPDVLSAEWETTKSIADLVRVEVYEQEVDAGRARSAEILRKHVGGEEADGGDAVVAVAKVDTPTETADEVPEAVTPPLAEVSETELRIREYHAALVETLWRVTEATRTVPAKPGTVYEASIHFQAPLDQLVAFVSRLESEVPWLHVTGLSIGISNADGPMLTIGLSMEARIL